MPGTGEVFAAGCPSRVVLDHVTSKWGVLVLVALADGPQRWSELRRRAEGISEKMLAQTLRTLEADGFVHRDAQPVIPPRVDYSLTERGAELVALLLPLFGWVVANADDIVGERAPHRLIGRDGSAAGAVRTCRRVRRVLLVGHALGGDVLPVHAVLRLVGLGLVLDVGVRAVGGGARSVRRPLGQRHGDAAAPTGRP